MTDPQNPNPQDPRFAATQFAPDAQPAQPSPHYGPPAPYGQSPPQQQQQQGYGPPQPQAGYAPGYGQPQPQSPYAQSPQAQYSPQQPYGQAPYQAPERSPDAGYGQPQAYAGSYGAPPAQGPYRYPIAQGVGNEVDIAKQLQVMSILQYVMAGLSALGAVFVVFYVVVGGVVLAGAGMQGSASEAGVGVFMIVLAVIMLVACGLIASLHVLAGKSLVQRRRHTFLIVLACLSMLSIPIGTGIGIWMLMVLTKPEVKATFT